jgi:flagellar basal-body rod protein FlgG
MIDALTMTEAAMLVDVERLRAASHNIANSSTLGFKREIALSRPSFEATVSGFGLAPWAPGAPVATTATDHRGGTLRLTGNPLDIALEGDGFFVLGGAAGEIYSRQGEFRLDRAGKLVNAAGLPVLGESGEIVLSSAEPRIDRQGGIWEGENLVGRLRVVQFQDPGRLESLGGGTFAAGAAAVVPGQTVNIRQGFVEAANVSAMHEMVRLIETMRHFEASQHLLRGYDAMTGTALSTLGSL